MIGGNDSSSAEQHDLQLREAERDCLVRTQAHAQPPDQEERYCGPFWDGWGCWNFTVAGSRAYISCPSYMPGFDPRLSAYRDCNPDGTWWRNPITNNIWANYTTCINAFELAKSTRLIYIYIVGYSVSMVTLMASIAIFVIFRRQLKCDRVTLHKHLFSSYILNGIAWILYYVLAALNASVIASNPVWCQALHVVTQYFVTCNFFWMFCEGCYLHTIIVLAFTNSRKLLLACYATGWGSPVVMATTYAVARWNSEDPDEWQQCWIKESLLQWIVQGPIVLTVIMNLIFLCNIVRLLVTKLRAGNSPEALQMKKAVKATLILIPLLGLQYILFPMRPEQGNVAEDAYLTIVALVTSLQGVFVAVLFCFMNGEVVGAVKHRWHQHKASVRKASDRQRSLTQTSEQPTGRTAPFRLSPCSVPAGDAGSLLQANGNSVVGLISRLRPENEITSRRQMESEEKLALDGNEGACAEDGLAEGR